MDIQNLKDTVSGAFQKSAEFISAVKNKCTLKLEIAKVEGEIRDSYIKLGKLSFGGAAAESVTETAKDLKTYIKGQYVKLDNLNAELEEMGCAYEDEDEENADSDSSFCTACGKAYGVDDIFCSKCGKPLNK